VEKVVRRNQNNEIGNILDELANASGGKMKICVEITNMEVD
jgi:hypothetical protein